MTVVVTPALHVSQNNVWLIWQDAVLLAACPDRLVARRIAALVDVYGLVDLPDTLEEVLCEFWDDEA